MAQIFAADRAAPARATRATTARSPQDSAPERGLAALQARADLSEPTQRLAQMQPLQLMEEEELMQGKAAGDALQRQGVEEEELMQGKAAGQALQRQESSAATGSGTGKGGLPGGLRQGIESLSGADLSGVKVHYGSAAPAQVGAHAFAQGRDIHLAQGQEKHLPHEAWHVVQQQQGRVAPTMDVGGTPVNDDPGLEKEADVMGEKATQFVAREGRD